MSVPRPPVVAVLGHVNHGKSSLLDYIRKTNVVGEEAGNITQRLGAYEVIVPQIGADITPLPASPLLRGGIEGGDDSQRESARRVTFLDTPGHEAFKGIRERGATVADVAVLVVSGEEGVKPQTTEALRYIETAKIPYLVAITKIDKPNADPERVKQGLAEHRVFVEGYGGDIPCTSISSKTGEGVPELLEMILLVADLHPVATDMKKPASGFVIESNCEQRSGISATVLIKNGTLRRGSFVAAEEALAPVRFIKTSRGEKVSEAGAGQAVCVTGWNSIPRIGARFSEHADKKDAEEQRAAFSEAARRKTAPRAVTSAAQQKKVLIPVIIKADAGGSVEAVEHELKKLETEQITLVIVSRGIGALSESDLKTAASCQSPLIVGFNVGIDSSAHAAFERSGTPYATFDVIYKLTEWVAERVNERTPKVYVEEVSGNARIIKLFSAEKDKQIIGGKVAEGELRRGDEFRVLRRDALIGAGKIRELQRQKEKIEAAPKDSEFGALVNSSVEIAVGDKIEAFTIVEK